MPRTAVNSQQHRHWASPKVRPGVDVFSAVWRTLVMRSPRVSNDLQWRGLQKGCRRRRSRPCPSSPRRLLSCPSGRLAAGLAGDPRCRHGGPAGGGCLVSREIASVRPGLRVMLRGSGWPRESLGGESAYLGFSVGRWASAASRASSAAQSTWGATPRPSQLVPVTESVQYPNGSSLVTVAASRISVT